MSYPEKTITFCGKQLKRTFHFIIIVKNESGKNIKKAVCSDCGKEKYIAW